MRKRVETLQIFTRFGLSCKKLSIKVRSDGNNDLSRAKFFFKCGGGWEIFTLDGKETAAPPIPPGTFVLITNHYQCDKRIVRTGMRKIHFKRILKRVAISSSRIFYYPRDRDVTFWFLVLK